MFIHPGALESSSRKYRPEPFATTADSTGSVESQVLYGRSGIVWAVKEFDVRLETPGELRFRLLASLFFLVWVSSADIRRGLFVAPLLVWLAFDSLRTLIRLGSSDWYDSITLETDRLIRTRSGKVDLDSLQYEQICMVKLATTTPTSAGPVEVNYYPYDEQTGSLNLARLRARILPVTVDDAGLYDEIRRRAYGPPPTRRAQLDLLVWRIFRLGLILGAALLYAFVIGRIGR